MNRAIGNRAYKLNLKLLLCLLGIVIVIGILIAMHPLPSSKNSGAAAVKPAAAKNQNGSGISAVTQALLATQNAAAVGQPTGMAGSANPQITQTGYSVGSSSNTSSASSIPPAQPSTTPPADPDVLLYPIDPVPCKWHSNSIGCGVCGPYQPLDSAPTSCLPKCPGGGIEMMCAYPL